MHYFYVEEVFYFLTLGNSQVKIKWSDKSIPDVFTSKDSPIADTVDSDNGVNISKMLSLNDAFAFPDVLNFYCSIAKPNAFVQRLPAADFGLTFENNSPKGPKILCDCPYFKENAQLLNWIAARLAQSNLIALIDFETKVNFIYRKPRKVYVVMRPDMEFEIALFRELIEKFQPGTSIHAVITGGNSFRVINLHSSANQSSI